MKSINLIELLMKKLENAINLDKLITNMKAIFKIKFKKMNTGDKSAQNMKKTRKNFHFKSNNTELKSKILHRILISDKKKFRI